MKGLISLLSDLIEAEVVQRAQQGTKNAAMIVAATLLFFGGFIALMAAAYHLLTDYMSQEAAALIIAAIFILAGVILVLIVMRSQSQGARSRHSAKSPQQALEEKAREYIRENSVSAAVLALVAGAAVGSNPELRSILLRAIDRFTAPPPPEK